MKPQLTRRWLSGLALIATTQFASMAVLAAEEGNSTKGLFEASIDVDTGSLPESDIIGFTWKKDPDPALRAFATWVHGYLAAAREDRADLEAEGEKLAIARKKALLNQIKTDPRRALANAIPIAIRKQLPADIVKHLEKRVDTFANWGTECHLSEKEAHDQEVAEIGGRTFNAFHYGGRDGARSVEGGSLHGIAIDNNLAVLNSPLRALEPGEIAGGRSINFSKIEKPGPSSVGITQTSLPTSGGNLKQYQIGGNVYGRATNASQAERVASVIRGKQNSYKNLSESISSDDGWVLNETPQYLSDSGAPGTSGTAGRPPLSHTTGTKRVLVIRVQSATHPLSSVLLGNTFMSSQGADFHSRFQYMSNNQLGLTFTYTPVYNLPSSFDNFNADAWRDEAKARAQSDGYNLNNYDVFATVHGTAPVGYAGLCAGNNIWMHDNWEAWCWVHEFGHYLSLPHARRWYSNDGNPMSASRSTVEYGDWMCYMGNGTNNYAYRMYSGAYMNRLRWSPDSDIQTVTRSGTYTVYQYDNNVYGRVRSLKVPRDDNYTYWLTILGRAEPAGVNHVNGVAIRAQDAFMGNQNTLVDMSSNGGAGTAPLALNATWYDSAADVTFKVVAVGGSDPNRYAQVQVTFGAQHKVAYRPLVHNGIYRFSNRALSNISIAGNASSANDLPLAAVTSNDADPKQQWVCKRNSDGSYSFNLLGTNQYISVASNSFANGADILQSAASAGDQQRFYVNLNPDGFISFGHKASDGNSSACLDLATGGPDLLQWGYGGGTNQQWKPELIGVVPGQKYRLIPQNGQGQAIEVQGTANLAPVKIWGWNGGSNQVWTVASVTGGFRFNTDFSPRVLDISTATGLAALWDANGGSNQRFTISRSGGQWVRFIPGYNSTYSLEATGSANGSDVYAKPNTGGSGQLWRFADVDG